ncbi:Receptor-like protein 12 [Nymphaea thermarum]|nr:Receptor-like protein 12 [Nymphaea thermarum]
MSCRHTTVFLITALLLIPLTCAHKDLEEQEVTQPPAASAVLCHLNQSSALLRLKHSISKFLSPEELSSWQGNGSDCCRWQGITCDSITGFVIKLQIPEVTDGDIIGSTDPSLFELKQLQLLDLSYNGFNRSIPKRLVELTRLTHLDLFYCSFTGLVQLQHLRLDEVRLSMSGREVSTALVSSPSLLKLQTLTLSYCNISGPLVDSLDRQLQSLSHLDLRHNDLQRVPKFVEHLTSLTILKLSSCGLQGNFSWSIFLLPKLVILNVSDNVDLAVIKRKICQF